MSIFDEVKRSISSTGKQVAKRTKEISDAVSIRSQINEEKENVAKLYATVGKKVFQNATEADEEKFFMEFTSIRSSLERKRELEERLTGMDGCIYCSECGARIDKNSKFCNKCGTRVDKNKPPMRPWPRLRPIRWTVLRKRSRRPSTWSTRSRTPLPIL